MEQSLRIKTDDLRPALIEGLKKYFNAINAKELTISFSTPKKKSRRIETQEETRARIEKAINDTDPNNFIFFTCEEFEAMAKALSTIK